MLDAGTLAGLLADGDRRSVFAALVLGSSTLDDVMRATGLDAKSAGRSLARFVESGLVERGDDGAHLLLAQAFSLAARAAAPPRTPLTTPPTTQPTRSRPRCSVPSYMTVV